MSILNKNTLYSKNVVLTLLTHTNARRELMLLMVASFITILKLVTNEKNRHFTSTRRNRRNANACGIKQKYALIPIPVVIFDCKMIQAAGYRDEILFGALLLSPIKTDSRSSVLNVT